MTLETVFLLSALLLPFAVNLVWRRPEPLFLAAGLIFLFFGVVITSQTGILLSQSSQIDRAFHDTYHVVAKGNYWRNIGIILLTLSVIIWTQRRLGALLYPKLTILLFWMLHVGLLVIVGLPEVFPTFALMPRRYVDYPEAFRVLNFWRTSATALTGISLVALIILLIWSSVQTWKSRGAP